jgi:hypothetical protein
MSHVSPLVLTEDHKRKLRSIQLIDVSSRMSWVSFVIPNNKYLFIIYRANKKIYEVIGQEPIDETDGESDDEHKPTTQSVILSRHIIHI